MKERHRRKGTGHEKAGPWKSADGWALMKKGRRLQKGADDERAPITKGRQLLKGADDERAPITKGRQLLKGAHDERALITTRFFGFCF